MRIKQAKKLIKPWISSLYNGNSNEQILVDIAEQAIFHMCHPFGDIVGARDFYRQVISPLLKAMPDLERRDTIVIAGDDEDGQLWVGCCGFYLGTFFAPWLNIAPTGHIAHMRFHEFYRIKDNKVVEFQAVWDIPELMMQAGVWPLSPSLGKDWCVPSPVTQDGIVDDNNYCKSTAKQSLNHVIKMLKDMVKHPRNGPQAMQLSHYWDEKMNWYGPAGIGSARGISGFRNWHQIPFLKAMPDRGQHQEEVTSHFFAERSYVAVAGWPNMKQTISDDGWLGIAPSNQKITLRSLDFWRLENGKIRENWVLIDLLDIYAQINVDVFARIQDFNKVRHLQPINLIGDKKC